MMKGQGILQKARDLSGTLSVLESLSIGTQMGSLQAQLQDAVKFIGM